MQRVMRATKDLIEFRRIQVVLHSAQGFAPAKIADMVGYSVDHVRTLIREFNQVGFEMLKPKYCGGRPPTFTVEVREKLVSLCTSRPRDLGLPYGEWSLSKIREVAIQQGIIESISLSWLDVILHEADMARLETKTWKQSNDPEFEKKKRRVESLTRRRRNPPVVLSMDELGPVQKVPTKGEGWHHSKHPHRVPATYKKPDGIRYLLGSFHLGGDRMWGALVDGRDANNWLLFLQEMRCLFPRNQRIYVIQDNLSTHWTAETKAWARENKVSLVATPTNASWLNPIEPHFTEIKSMALDGSNFQTWEEIEDAFQGAIAYRNKRGTIRRPSKRGLPLWKRH